LSTVCLGGGDPGGARATAAAAITSAQRYGQRLHEIDGHLALARAVLADQGAAARAAIEDALARSTELIEATGAISRTPCMHLARAELAGALGNRGARRRELRAAQRLFTEMGAPTRATHVAQELDR